VSSGYRVTKTQVHGERAPKINHEKETSPEQIAKQGTRVIEHAIRRWHPNLGSSNELTKADLDRVTELNLSSTEFQAAAGLEELIKLKQLKVLRLDNVDELEPLRNLTDLSALSGLTQLEKLSLRDNDISDLSPLSGLRQLKFLDLEANLISDLSPLSGLKQLESLKVSPRRRDHRVRDVSPLSDLKQLMMLNLESHLISDLTPLFGLKKLKVLDLRQYYGRTLTKTQIDELQKALPNCKIKHTATP